MPIPRSLLPVTLVALVACGGPNANAPQDTPVAPTSDTDPWAYEPVQQATAHERGVEALHAGRHREAIAWFDRAIEETDGAAVYADRAVARLAVSEPLEALADAAAAVDRAPTARHRLNQANIQVRCGLFAEAETTLRSLLEANPDERDAQLSLAILLAETDRADDAATLLVELVDADRRDADAWNVLGIARERAGDPPGAIDAYNRALGADGEHLDAMRNLGMAQLRAGDDRHAARTLERYLRNAPYDAVDRGVIQGRLDRLRDAQ